MRFVAVVFLLFGSLVSSTIVFAQQLDVSVKKTVKQIEKINDNATSYKKLDSLQKLAGLSTEALVVVKLSLAKAAIKVQKYNDAVKICHQGIVLAKKVQLDTAHAYFYMLLGGVNYYMLKYPEAISYFKKSIALAKQKNILIIEANGYQNLGGAFIDSKKLDSGEKYLNLTIELSKRCGKECNKYRFMAFRILATLYERKKEYDKSIKIFTRLEKEALSLNDTTLTCSTLIFHARLLSLIGKKRLALQKMDNATKLMRKYKGRTDDDLFASLAHLSSSHADVGNYKTALNLILEANQIRAELFKKTNQQQINELETKFRLKEIQQEKDLAERNAAVEVQKKKLWIAVLIVVVLFFILVTTVIYLQNKRRKADDTLKQQKKLVDAILTTEEKERSRIAKDLHDGIVQDLAALKLNLNAATIHAPLHLQSQLHTLVANIDATTKEVRNISYQMMPVSLKELGLKHALTELLNRSFEANNIKFEFNLFGIDERLPERTELTIYRICQELVHNTIKHSGASQVMLLLQLRQDVLLLTYEDDGKGFDEITVKKGIGLNSMASRIEMVNGNFEISTSPEAGTTVFIRIPL